MFRVEGYDRDGAPYAVQVGAPSPGIGVIAGTGNAVGLLHSHAGATVKVAPVGPAATLDLDDPRAVLIALHALTQVTLVQGDDVPNLFEAAAGDVDY